MKAVPKKVSNRTSEQIQADLKAADYQKRQEGFIAGVNELQKTFKVKLDVIMYNTRKGNYPGLVIEDTKEEVTKEDNVEGKETTEA